MEEEGARWIREWRGDKFLEKNEGGMRGGGGIKVEKKEGKGGCRWEEETSSISDQD